MTPKQLPEKDFSDNIWQACEQRYMLAPEVYLGLQDNYQVNVNLLLLAQYLDKQDCLLSVEQWQGMIQVIEPFEQSIIQPYRHLRRIAKAHLASDEYQKMLEVELIMERKSQKMLLQHLNEIAAKKPLSTLTAVNNTQGYLSLFGLTEHDIII